MKSWDKEVINLGILKPRTAITVSFTYIKEMLKKPIVKASCGCMSYYFKDNVLNVRIKTEKLNVGVPSKESFKYVDVIFSDKEFYRLTINYTINK